MKKSDTALREEETLAVWQEKGIFQKSLTQTADGEPFSFYDGPPFANGLPHYGHILSSVIKDAIPRYQTMKGRFVRRVWGWDCHGLPIENVIEKELSLGHKKDIEDYGIEKFNDAALASVLRYEAEWKKIIPRIGRWVDMENSYKTMDANYSESIWWAFKTLHDKGLVYQSFKSMHICTRCETTLSNNEVAEGYKDVADISVTAKFELVDEPGTFVLAWTTTPWTLPGNVALAVNPDEEYVKFKYDTSLEVYICSYKCFVSLLKNGGNYDANKSVPNEEVLEKFKGGNIIGKSYKPVFDYYASDTKLENHGNGWKIYGADFVTMDSGTGVVHIAPAFGEDDMALGKKENLPFIQHVGMDGIMKPEARDFAGLSVKPKSDDEKTRLATDIAVLKYLQDNGTFFSKEKIKHSYPHCWRCDTPLLNYAAESWFVKVSALKEKLLSENATTKWVPKNMRDGRFGKWLEGARDWAISRSRYWGAPLPVWVCSSCDARFVAGSRAELALKTKRSGNRYLVMRHGEAEHNLKNIVSSKISGDTDYPLTEKGRTDITHMKEKLLVEKIDIIISSPFKRTKETAETIAKMVGFDPQNIIIEERIQEINTGIFDGKSIDEYRAYFASMREKFTKSPEGGENLLDVKRRVMEFLEDLEAKYSEKTILIITHEYSAWMMVAGSEGATIDEAVYLKEGKEDFLETGEIRELSFTPFPHNSNFEFSVHRPYIDNIQVSCTCGGDMARVPYVFDCWFESGSMPYAQFHYPFENKELFEKNFPANFISEGVDQTRGWFYSMLVLSVGLFDKTPFEQVIVNGMVLAEDGKQKLSKKLKNYPDPTDIINNYGVDALRYYLLSSPIVRSEDLAFSEKGVDEVAKKIIARLLNVLSFYELYGKGGEGVIDESKNPLDQWIFARLAELGQGMTLSFDAYELDRAVKPIGLFVDDLSTWYLRRSRERFKSDDVADRVHAIKTTRMVLLELSKLLAPVMPFLAEHLYSRMGGKKESVHLESWPKFKESDKTILANMAEVRRVVSLALEARAKNEIRVRQPLEKLTIKNGSLDGKTNLTELILDEVNIKKIAFEPNLLEEVVLDTNITTELEDEGHFRDCIRSIRDLRKAFGLTLSEPVKELLVTTGTKGKLIFSRFEEKIKKATLLQNVTYVQVSENETITDEELFGFELSN